MSELLQPQPADAAPTIAEDAAPPSRLQSAWVWIERWLVRVGDRLNPILVKETRQAIKSRQFSLTFLLVLAAVCVVTFGGVAVIGPDIFYSSSGPEMFQVYYWVLCFPLAIIVPYSAFRSLAAEKEDNTFELLSVSNLTPRQIIAGKLGSALAQMLIYVSAIAPCLAFTYLLRGIDVLTIALLITYAILGSLALCVVGLLIATSAKARYGQVVMSVALVVGLVVAFFLAVGAAIGFIAESYQMLNQKEFWIANAAALTAYLTTFTIVFLAAAAQISFTSENRSTPLRIAMIIQFACFLGWMGYAIAYASNEFRQRGGQPEIGEIAVIAGTMCGVYWFIMGAMMIAEWPVLSRRVQRQLPQSFLGRVFLTWFNPGPGTGYVFAIANLCAVVLIGLLLVHWLAEPLGLTISRFFTASNVTYFLIIGLGYITAFLGVGKLLVDQLRRFAVVPVAGAVLLQAFLLAAGCFIPLLIQLMSRTLRNTGYSLLHASNPFWSLAEIVDSRTLPAEADVLIFLIPGVAIIVFMMNLPSIAREIQRQRVAPPARVIEEETALHPPEAPKPQSPWDVTQPAE